MKMLCKKLVALLVPFGEATLSSSRRLVLCFALVAATSPAFSTAENCCEARKGGASVPAYALAPQTRFEKVSGIDRISAAVETLNTACNEAINAQGISRYIHGNIADENFEKLRGYLEEGNFKGVMKVVDRIYSDFKRISKDIISDEEIVRSPKEIEELQGSYEKIVRAIEDLRGLIEQRIADADFINEQLEKIEAAIRSNAPPHEDASFVVYRSDLLIEARSYLEKEEFGASYQALQELEFYVPKEANKKYQAILSNLEFAFRRRLEKTMEYKAARRRSRRIKGLLRWRLQNPKNPQSLEIPDETISPPDSETGSVRVFEEDLSLMPEDLQEKIKKLAGNNFIGKDAEKEARCVSEEEVQIYCVVGAGGLSRRGGVYFDHKRWIEKILGWVRLGDLRLAQLAHKAKQFKKVSVIIIESYFTSRRVDEVLNDVRADIEVFGGLKKIRRIKSSLTPTWHKKDGSVYEPYSLDGLGVASHGDLFLQPLLTGAIGDILKEAGDEKDNVYIATSNMNVPLSLPSPELIGDFHNLRKRLKKDEKAVPFVAFQLAPAKGEKGGMLAYIEYKGKKVLQIVEGFLVSGGKKNAMVPKEYPGFNTNHAVIAANDFVKCFFDKTNITADDLTSDKLKDPKNFKRVLDAINAKGIVPKSPDEFLTADFRRKLGTFIEEKKNVDGHGTDVAQVSTMLNGIARLMSEGYDSSVYYISPRDIDSNGIERRFYGEYKERNQGKGSDPKDQRDNLQRTADIFARQNLLKLKAGRGGEEWFEKKMIIRGIHYRRTVDNIKNRTLPAKAVLVGRDKAEILSIPFPKEGDRYAITHALWQGLPDDMRYGDIRVSESDTEIRVEIDVIDNIAALSERVVTEAKLKPWGVSPERIRLSVGKTSFGFGRWCDPAAPGRPVAFVRIGHLLFVDSELYGRLSPDLRAALGKNVIIVPELKHNILAQPIGCEHTIAPILLLLDAPLKDKRGIDKGAGDGVLALVAAKLGATSSVLIDNDSQMLDKAKVLFSENGLGGQEAPYIVEANLTDPEGIETKLRALNLAAQDTVVIANIGAWPQYTVTNAEAIALVPVVEQATCSVVTDFIAGGYLSKEALSLLMESAESEEGELPINVAKFEPLVASKTLHQNQIRAMGFIEGLTEATFEFIVQGTVASIAWRATKPALPVRLDQEVRRSLLAPESRMKAPGVRERALELYHEILRAPGKRGRFPEKKLGELADRLFDAIYAGVKVDDWRVRSGQKGAFMQILSKIAEKAARMETPPDPKKDKSILAKMGRMILADWDKLLSMGFSIDKASRLQNWRGLSRRLPAIREASALPVVEAAEPHEVSSSERLLIALIDLGTESNFYNRISVVLIGPVGNGEAELDALKKELKDRCEKLQALMRDMLKRLNGAGLRTIPEELERGWLDNFKEHNKRTQALLAQAQGIIAPWEKNKRLDRLNFVIRDAQKILKEKSALMEGAAAVRENL